ncbi:pyridoxal phosphate biosynthesis protein [Sphaerochaeta pleomorpha str. Grapes]|uniref:Pyridoxal phosphate biosynthesis protein n=1 Tax=Sphaerochaeta pleomorpha (strain ATCC BAA-1885 / DSM 22778 / Grapes) TaxID=158190 RepID=G8QXV0_SPHPG|nr:4-hydroxythreonine-4-phosphate dehydrogenase PdxA [Sphaerochaeta pleomorpha]AEV30744.1 pyridoxal phosphate biosynthesis protein [Sphaerochaeta pleomorpha str. Grapes]
MNDNIVYLTVPMGDPAGIGPEIVLKVIAQNDFLPNVALVFVADRQLLELTASRLSLPFSFDAIVGDDPSLREAMQRGARTILYALGLVNLQQFSFGQISANSGKAAYDCVAKCVQLVTDGLGQGIVTPPLHKEALKKAQVPQIGYTEILSYLTGTENAVTMFDTLGMKIFFHTRHLSLIEACKAVKTESILHTILTCNEISTRSSAFNRNLSLAIAGLNPHCGEHGLFGNEEQEALVPAVLKARELGVSIEGPIGADSVFYQTRMGKYRAVISLYHDQGHIAAKTLDFNQTISVTWGLPFLRTSVDHGTAFDIAGKGIANSQGMARAILVASEYLISKECIQ